MHLFQFPYVKKETVIASYVAEDKLFCGTSVSKNCPII